MSSRRPTGSRVPAAGGDRRKAASSGPNPAAKNVRMIREKLERDRAAHEAAEAEAKAAEAKRAEEEKRAKEEEEEGRQEEQRMLREERRRRRQEGRKRAEREEKRRMEAARRRLGIAVAGTAGGGGDCGAQKRPVYDSRRPKLQPKGREYAQSEAVWGQTLDLKHQLEGEQINALSEDVGDVLELGEEQSIELSGDGRITDDDDDDAWENKSFDDVDILLRGESPCFEEEEVTEKDVISAAPAAESVTAAEEVEEHEVSNPQAEG